ncbi:MAG: peptide/nickel transport system permease protein [Thermomicrobiales bacterium]|jgi:peptide/nickel transport system permease protein|nr:peptide/nickel transport system permease protein [Thermomicrobiales bacterium]MEA2597917.1 peptide/nickel transport system permease protein [Thermomicrobiales bacterium]
MSASSDARTVAGEHGDTPAPHLASARSLLDGASSRSAPGFYRLAWRRYRKNKVALVALAIVAAIVIFSLAADVVSTYVTGFDVRKNNLDERLSKPGQNGYILGSDGNGRDLLTRLAYGGRVSLAVAALATLSTMLIGGTLGACAGYFGGLRDATLMRLADVLLSIPTLSLLILISSLYHPGYAGLALFIAAVGWPGLSRLVRGDILQLRTREFVDAARVLGASDRRILTRHLLPNALPTMIVWSSQVIPGFILTEAALSFLGFGVRIPTPSWGNMLAEAQQVYRTNWTNVFFPGFLIFLTSLTINLAGNGLRDAFDPRLKD